MSHDTFRFEPLFGDERADAVLELCERYGTYGQYSTETSGEEFAPELAQRYDAAINFVRTGGRFGRRQPVSDAVARTNYFREEYAYGDEVLVPGIEPFLHHEGFVEAARELHGRPVIVPAIVYANILIRGQELALHTDVPEFRGANRRRLPQWLLVVMRHSGLFERWRMPIATGIAYFGGSEGGALAYYPDGPDRPPRTLPTRHDTAVLLDTDTVFHGVDRVGGPDAPAPPLQGGATVTHVGGGWLLSDETGPVERLDWADVRLSVSWKAYCFADEAERRAWLEHHDDLTPVFILERLTRDLEARGRLPGGRPDDDHELARLLIDEYIRFPEPETEPESAGGDAGSGRTGAPVQ